MAIDEREEKDLLFLVGLMRQTQLWQSQVLGRLESLLGDTKRMVGEMHSALRRQGRLVHQKETK